MQVPLITFFSLVTIVQVVNFTFCNDSPPVTLLGYLGDAVPRFILSITLLILAVIQTLKHSVEMYRATKQWQPNRYMQLLVRDGILYFLLYVPLHPFSFTTITFSRPSYTCVLAEN